MKKFLVITSLIISLALGNSVSAKDIEIDMVKIRTITEIGTLSNAKKYSEALEKCETALKKYPQEPELYYWSASIKSELGNNEAAIVDYDKAIKLNPKISNAYVMRGISKSELKDYDGAIADFDYAISINPNDSSAFSMRACVKLEMGDIEGASKDLEYANKIIDEAKIPKKPEIN